MYVWGYFLQPNMINSPIISILKHVWISEGLFTLNPACKSGRRSPRMDDAGVRRLAYFLALKVMLQGNRLICCTALPTRPLLKAECYQALLGVEF